MTLERWRRSALCSLFLLLSVVACGKKGPPLAPLRLVPASVGEASVRHLGQDVFMAFTIPDSNSDASTPADIGRVEVYGLTAAPLPPNASPLTDEEFREVATLLAVLDLRPPTAPAEAPEDDAAEAGGAVTPPPEPVDQAAAPYEQGQLVGVFERLTAEVMVPVDLTEVREELAESEADEPEAEVPVMSPLLGPLIAPVLEPPLRRVYVAVGVTRGGRRSPLQPKLPAVLVDPPHPTSYPNVRYTNDVVTITWVPARGARRPVQGPSSPQPLPTMPAPTAEVPVAPVPLSTTSIRASLEPTRYNVYEVLPPVPDVIAAPVPLNPTPIDGREFQDLRVEFGVERCYVVRTIDLVDERPIESDASPETCVTFVDTFAPAAPINLAAVGSAGTINLIWDASTEADLAGYLVLRGEVPGETLQPLTSEAIQETTYRDTAITAGVTYVYAVVAVDTATPPNASAPSNRVQETPR